MVSDFRFLDIPTGLLFNGGEVQIRKTHERVLKRVLENTKKDLGIMAGIFGSVCSFQTFPEC